MKIRTEIPGTHDIFGVSLGHGNELARTQLMVRYYREALGESCGCNALLGFSGKSCDAAGVCGGQGVGNYSDCYGTAFGSAYVDSCGRYGDAALPIFYVNILWTVQYSLV
jgi:hypothetical protein